MKQVLELAQSIAATIGEYRLGQIDRPGEDHVLRWVGQFEEAARGPLLQEIDHVLKKTYFSRAGVDAFLRVVLQDQKFAGDDPKEFWRQVRFLDIQEGGTSQRDLLEEIAVSLHALYGLDLRDCGGESNVFLYVDDVLFSGNRIRNDLTAWITSSAPDFAKVFVVMIGFHQGGLHYAQTRLAAAATAAGKQIEWAWWRAIEIEDRKSYTDVSDVLRPTRVPDNKRVQEYVARMTYQPTLRGGSNTGGLGFFSSPEGRDLLEQEMLKAGVNIRDMSPYLNAYMRPLGNSVLETLGFGTLIATYRNCPNNAPLALWAGDPWYPLLPRRTN